MVDLLPQNMVFKPEFKILSKLIDQNLVIPLLVEEPGFLVLDLKDPELEAKAIRIHSLFQRFMNTGKSYITQG